MMVLQYGHQMDVMYRWLTTGQHCVWLGDFALGMQVYERLDRRSEADWVAQSEARTSPRNFHEYTEYVARKRMFDYMWFPNPISGMGNAYNDEQLTTWISTEYPPMNFPYLPVSVFAALVRSYHRTRFGTAYSCLGSGSVPVKVLHGVDMMPAAHPPAVLLRNFLVATLKGNRDFFSEYPLRVLFPNAGNHAGICPLMLLNLSRFHGSVHCLDSDAEAISNIQYNHARLREIHSHKKGQFRSLKAETRHTFLPARNKFKRFNLAVLTPKWLPDEDTVASYIPSFSLDALRGYYDLDGYNENIDFLMKDSLFCRDEEDALEYQFSHIDEVMDADGVVIVLWSNLQNILLGTDAHPVVAELERNTRFSLEHFEDIPFQLASQSLQEKQGMPFLADLNRKLKVELWVLRVNRLYLAPTEPLEQHGLIPTEDHFNETGLAVVDGETPEGAAKAVMQREADTEGLVDRLGLDGNHVDYELLAKVQAPKKKRRIRSPELEYFNPRDEMFDYSSNKRVKRDTRLVEGHQPQEEGVQYNALLRAKTLKEGEVKRERSERKRRLQEVGLGLKPPRCALPRKSQGGRGGVTILKG